LETISVDVLELSLPSGGYRHILVCVGEFKGFMISCPSSRKPAAEVLSNLVELPPTS
jgi:hypothetical protein